MEPGVVVGRHAVRPTPTELLPGFWEGVGETQTGAMRSADVPGAVGVAAGVVVNVVATAGAGAAAVDAAAAVDVAAGSKVH